MFLTIVHFLHVLTGVIWAGGTMALAWGFYPVLAAQGAGQAKPIHDRAAKALGPLMGASGGLLMILGLVRAWAGGRGDALCRRLLHLWPAGLAGVLPDA